MLHRWECRCHHCRGERIKAGIALAMLAAGCVWRLLSVFAR